MSIFLTAPDWLAILAIIMIVIGLACVLTPEPDSDPVDDLDDIPMLYEMRVGFGVCLAFAGVILLVSRWFA